MRFGLLLLLGLWGLPGLMGASRIDSLEGLLERHAPVSGMERAGLERELASAYFEDYRYREALEHYEAALDLTRRHGTAEELFAALTAIGYAHYTAYAYAKALPYYNEALDIAYTMGNDSLRAVAYDWMSLQYLYSDAYGQAIHHQLESIRLREALHDSLGLAESYYSMGDILGHQRKYDESKAYFRRCIRLATHYGQDYLLVGAYGTVGQHFADELNWDSAAWYAGVALRIAEEEDMDYGIAFTNSILGDGHREAGRLDSAAIHYHRALETARRMQDPDQIATALVGLGRLAVLEGRRTEAISRFRQALAVKDSLHEERAASMVSTLEARYGILQTESEQQAALYAKDRALRRLTVWVTGIITALVLLLAWVFWRHGRKQRQLNAVLEEGHCVIQRQNAQLSQANEDLKQFAYAASHDLKQPLRTIGNFAALLERKFADRIDADAADYFGFIRQATRDMASLLTNLLDYTQLENKADSFEDLDLNDVLHSVQVNLTTLIQDKRANVLAEALPPLRANRQHMVLVFQNLINNGLKFNDKPNPEIRVEVEDLGGRYRFSVTDNGIGIEPSYTDKVFGLFQRVGDRDAFEGSGMGLAIAKRIVRQYQGDIWVESTPSRGSTFHFTVAARPAA
jgi:signal transduction histidine kinase